MLPRQPFDVPVSVESGLVKQLTEDNARLKVAGAQLAIAALRVATEYDGVHRLMLAVSAWSKAMADEGGRGDRESDGA